MGALHNTTLKTFFFHFIMTTVPFEDKRTTQRVPHAEPTRWRFELNAFAFACPRKRKRV